MASVTAPAPPLSAPHTAGATVRIEPPRGWLDLRLGEVWAYRELLYFFVWRDVKVRYKQTAIGVAWVVLQPLMTMGVFTLFFGTACEIAFQWAAVSGFLFHRAGALDVFRDGAAIVHGGGGG